MRPVHMFYIYISFIIKGLNINKVPTLFLFYFPSKHH